MKKALIAVFLILLGIYALAVIGSGTAIFMVLAALILNDSQLITSGAVLGFWMILLTVVTYQALKHLSQTLKKATQNESGQESKD